MTWPVVGHAWAVERLQQAILADAVPQALLITGPEGVGKTTLAFTLAQALLCQTADPAQRPCGVCPACRRSANRTHPDLLVVEPEEEDAALKIEVLRDLERRLRLRPVEGGRKVAIVMHFERATEAAANALLKTLEEPPAYAHLILLALEAETLLPTIVSRTAVLPLRPVPLMELRRALVERWGMDEAQADRLARLSGGRVGWALQPERQTRALQALELLFQALSADLPARFTLAETLARATPSLPELLETWRSAWRDVLLLQQGLDEITWVDHGAALRALAERISPETSLQVLQTLAQTLTVLDASVNAQLALEVLLMSLPTLA